MPSRGGATVLPACGGVGAQYTPTAGWAQAIRYRRDALGDSTYAGSIAVVHGGDASCATNGFWSALTLATTQRLPMLFYIEDNGYGISVRSELQTPGGNIAANLASFANLTHSGWRRHGSEQRLDTHRSQPSRKCARMRGQCCCV